MATVRAMRTNLLTLCLMSLSLASGCAMSTHSTQRSALGTPSSTEKMVALLKEPGPVELESIASCDWEVDRSGMVNLEHPRAKEAGLTDSPEPIQVFFHVLRHPTQGTFIVDTGVEKALRDDPSKSALGGLVRSVMKTEKMKFHRPLGEWVADEKTPLKGVFLTHLHLDHVSGMPDVPNATPIYAGPGEPGVTAFLNMFVQGSIDRAMAGKAPIHEWAYAEKSAEGFAGVLDVFGDGSVFALWVPGHTPGSTAYLVRSTKGPVLLTGDASHTRWGWDHDVEPGTFSADIPTSVASFKSLKTFAAAHPEVEVRLGHQH